MRIRTLRAEDRKAVEQVASLLLEGFKEHHPTAWPDMESALEEVEESFAQDRLSRIAVDDSGAVLGWIGGIRQYGGNVWELHPLVVRASHQRTGIGRVLVADLEERVRERNGLTLWLGTDDENSQTSLSATDLYPVPLSHVASIKNLRDHPYEFYQKVGFVIVGVMPDANGWGKPDIFMAKRVKSDRA